jgi:N-acetyltransferase
MPFDFNTILKNETIYAKPLTENDFEALYDVACDPLIWEQHPNKDRYKKEIFEVFFKGAIASKGAFLVLDIANNKVIGSSRFYDYNKNLNSILIGYTFFARSHWGSTYNSALKQAMLKHAFNFVNVVHFHIGANNIRSQKAITKLGALKIKEEEIAYYGEAKKLNFVYEINKTSWF